MLGAVSFTSTSGYAIITRVQCTFSENKVSIGLKNISSNQVNTTVRVTILYI